MVTTAARQVDVETVVDRLFECMGQMGYAPQAPSHEIEELDRQIFEAGRCGRCGGRVRLYPFFKPTPRSYRPFVVCSECGWEMEV